VACDYGLALFRFRNWPANQPPRKVPQSSFAQSQYYQRSQALPRLAQTSCLPKMTAKASHCRAPKMLDRMSATCAVDSLRRRARVFATGHRVVALEQELWTLSSEGFRRTNLVESAQVSPAVLAEQAHTFSIADKALTNNLISALAVDAEGRLWAGGFRSGIDVLNREGKRMAHLESDTSREINSLVEDPRSGTMLAATAQGLLSFDANLQAVRRLSTSDGLLSTR